MLVIYLEQRKKKKPGLCWAEGYIYIDWSVKLCARTKGFIDVTGESELRVLIDLFLFTTSHVF